MDKSSLLSLIEKYKAGECSAEEIVLLHTWMEQLAAGSQPVLLPENARQAVKDHVMAHLHIKEKPVKIFSLRKWVAAAVLLPFIGVTSWYLLKPAPVQWLSISTNAQEVRSVQLPDGSTAWLYAGTTLEYPAQFTGRERLVKIKGEAFFDVQPAPDQPFIVADHQLSIKVLGTSFNVRHWKEEPLKVMVATGKVQVQYDKMTLGVLQASQKLTYNPLTNRLLLDSASAVEAKGFVNGEMVCSNVSLREVLTELEAFYGVHFRNMPAEQGRFNVHFNEHMNLEDKLNILEKISITPAIRFVPAGDRTYLVRTTTHP
ncbi:hypothetical protein DCC81_18740 [Chitinophaga parva]|uniref:Uncharacterized protein n=1 Tax=Chitinophaga parva TaxID=2169414 RepID=A0A2T7BJ24_9BACT|nr:FecR family protein [Chitinophaga parva]PUZ26263.1 hypothetical protein DCC81_18740 [Chitinophaga parva]